ncbi:MAG: peptide chain release factor 2 [Candidatus Omnitrophica bacterium]|jgi:peptide chain release factor 2|nr:peptide chain release factor 2 [Candidatus Omnitrophota bacterium]
MQDIKSKIENFEKELTSLKEFLKIDLKKKEIEGLQSKMSEPNFWQNQKEASVIIEDLKKIKGDVDDWDVLYSKLRELKEFMQIADAAYESEIEKEAKKFEENLEKLKLKVLFCEKFDDSNSIVEINSGAGGTEACDWASMLFRMYFRWAEDKKFKFSVLDEVKGEEAGIKNITFLIEGLRAYGMLKSERGVHRLVRISPFDANKRRHTSFASVDVLPEIKDDIDIEIKPEELEVITCRASGAGGQHVNKTDSAVRITHLPTGIVVGCRNERSQHQNKAVALRVLKAKLYELKEEAKKKNLEKISGTKQKIEWGSQIRSYVLYPYLLVKDHRTDLENHDSWAVLDGKIDDFIYAYLKRARC